MWETGTFNVCDVEFTYEAKVFDVGSPCGINNGRISKLAIIKGKDDWSWGNMVVNYDRGWDIIPHDEISKKALEYVLNLYK